MDLKELKEILQILEEKEITEFELEEEGMKLRIRKAGPAPSNHAVAPVALPAAIPAAVPVAASAPRAGAPLATEPPLATPEAEAGLTVVKSPIVGTFFRTPDPNAPPFVSGCV